MNDEQLQALKEQSKNHKNKTLIIGGVEYSYTNWGTAVNISEEGKQNYRINGILKSIDGKEIEIPLKNIVKHFEDEEAKKLASEGNGEEE